MEKDIYKDFDIYARALVASGDHDPIYPVIKDILNIYTKFQPEFFVFVYVAFYNLATAIEFCNIWPTVASFQYGKNKFLKMRLDGKFRNFGHERRGTCRIPTNQLALFDAAKQFIEVDIDKYGLREEGNLKFRTIVESKPWHGSWAAYKIAEVFEKSLDWDNLKIQDLGIDGRDPNSNDGPVGGLRWLFGRDENFTKDWFPVWNWFGKKLSEAYGWDIGVVETVFCKAHKMFSGKYYVGHDVDELAELSHTMPEMLDNILSRNFPALHKKGITGLKKHQKSTYLKTGEIINSNLGKIFKPVDVKQIILDL